MSKSVRRSTRANRGTKYSEIINAEREGSRKRTLESTAADADASTDTGDLDSDVRCNSDSDDDYEVYEVVDNDGTPADSEGHADRQDSDAEDAAAADTHDAGDGDSSQDEEADDQDGKGYESWSARERKDLADITGLRVKAKTNKQYAPYIQKFKDWCKAQKPKIGAQVADIKQAPGVGRFLKQWIEGTWGGPYKNRKKNQLLSPQGAMNVHAALQHWVRECCTRAGTPVFNLTGDSGYVALYKKFTKDRNGKRKTLVPVSFTLDHFLRLQEHLYSSGDPDNVRIRFMLQLAASAVARGDEIRDIILCSMAVELIDIIGPASCLAVRYALGDNKTGLEHVPEQKAFIRGRVPETCTMAAMGEYLHSRFKLKNEQLPDPGTPELEAVYLFPGANASSSISYANHARLVREALKEVSILVEKVTHLTRIFAAQLLIAMGLRVEDVQRAGGWLKDCLGTAYIIISLSPEALLALAMWRKDSNDYQCFTDPRFFIAVPDDLLFHALPVLKTFQEKTEALKLAAAADGAAAALKERALRAEQLARVMRVTVMARVQDAIVTAAKYPDNPFNTDMMRHPKFSELAARFKATEALGGLQHTEPVAMREQLRKMEAGITCLQQLLVGMSSMRWQPNNSVPAAAAANGTAAMQGEQQQQGQQQGQQQRPRQQQQGQQQERQQQQQEGSAPPVGTAGAASSGRDQQQQQRVQQECPTSGYMQQQQQGSGAPDPSPAGPSSTGSQPGNLPAASPAGAAGPSGGAGSAEPMWFTPGGNAYRRADLPSGYTSQGMHNRNYWTGEEEPFQPPASRPHQPQAMYTAEEVQQMLRAVQQQQQQPAWGQPQQQQPHFAGAAAAAPGQQMPTVQPMFAADPFAQLMQPFISSNPSLAAALGSRVHQGMQQDNAAAAVVDLISGTIRSAIAEYMGVQASAATQMGTGTAAAAAGSAQVQQPMAAAAAPAGPAAAAGAAAGNNSAGVPLFKGWKSLTQLVGWFCEKEDVPWPEGEPEPERLVSREYFQKNGGSCWDLPKKQRVSEYNAIYAYLEKRAVDLTAQLNRPFSIMQAAEHVQEEMDVSRQGRRGQMTIPKFMEFCVAERKAARATAAAAAAAAAASEEGEEGAI